MEKHIIVVGGATYDIFGRPYNKLIQQDSNIGIIKTSIGGVGKNIAENLVMLNHNVTMITCFGNDDMAPIVKKNILDSGIKLDVMKVENGSSPTYMYITDENGDMQLAVASMSIYDNVKEKDIDEKLPLINSAALLVLDTNYSKESIEYIVNNAKVPIFLDCVSVGKARKTKDCTGKIHTIKANKIEAATLVDFEINSIEDAKKAGDILLNRGSKQVFITLGEEGVLAMNKDEKIVVPSFKADVKNTTGCGDSFMAGVVDGYLNNKTLKDTTIYGNAMAALTCESETSVSKVINRMSIQEVLDKRSIND